MSSYEYHQLLQYLYFEGYADSYEEAEELFESLDNTDLNKVIIAQYLYNEGYAETLQSAEIMSESISEEWVNKILDFSGRIKTKTQRRQGTGGFNT